MTKLSINVGPAYDACRLQQFNGQPSSKIGAAIRAVNGQTDKLPKANENKRLTNSVIHNKELKPLAKQIDLVLNEVRALIKNMGSSNASIRPSANECKSMHEDLTQLKDSIIEYKQSALSITSYKHNTKKTDKLNSLIKESTQLEGQLNNKLEKNKELKSKIANELNKSEREMNEREIKRNDIKKGY